MCSSKSQLLPPTTDNAAPAATINGRPVLQPATSNRPLFERRSLKKSLSLPKSPSIIPIPTPPPPHTAKTNNHPPNLKSPRQPAINDALNGMNTSSDKLVLTPPPTKCTTPKSMIPVKKSKNSTAVGGHVDTANPNSLVVKYSSAAIVDAPGSIAAARREQVAVMQVQRKMKIAHYGRSKSAKFDSCTKLISYSHLITPPTTSTSSNVREEKRCSFITPNSDPIYVAYHDEEWGVPVHDDKLLFELLVLTGAQVGSDWTSVLKKRQQFREAFSEFDAEIVSKFTEKKITSISAEFGIEVGLVRGVVDNSNCIIEIKKAFGSFHKYMWGFVNHKPIATQYKLSHKMPVKTSKSEAISKDMVRRGFRQVGPTIVHFFMQATGLTNDHLTTCPRHLQCRHLPSII